MKSNLKAFLSVLFLSILIIQSNAQISVPEGKAHLIEFTNETASFTVPEGKSWIIYSVFGDYLVGGVVEYDQYEKRNFLKDPLEVRVYLKNLNGIEKTNHLKNIYGTQLYRSNFSERVISYPLIFPEKTTFSLVQLKGSPGNFTPHNGKGYLSIVEIDN